jgi:hypothetical protein
LFWIYTSTGRTPNTTLHADGCGLLRLVKMRRGKTGPLSWDQLALLPVTYQLCKACRPGSTSRCQEWVSPPPPRRPAYGQRRLKSPRWPGKYEVGEQARLAREEQGLPPKPPRSAKLKRVPRDLMRRRKLIEKIIAASPPDSFGFDLERGEIRLHGHPIVEIATIRRLAARARCKES